MSWSEIPMDLLPDIINRLDVVDIVRSEAVCSWWRSIPYRDYSRKPQIPWLMLSSKDDDEIKFRYFYSLTEHKIHRISLPEIAGHHCVGSSRGYLLSIDRNADLIATNPLAGGPRLPLPPTSALPQMVGVLRDSSTGLITQYLIARSDGIPYDEDLEHIQKYYYRKAILSPDADIVVVIQGGKQSLAFARVGDPSWTALKVTQLDDIIFHKGRLYAIDFMGTIAVFDLDHPLDPPFMSPTGPLASEDGAPRRYLVESPCGENLFLLCKGYIYLNEEDTPRTNNFKVFLLDKATYKWSQMKTLGDVSLFLGFNYSMSLCTREFPCIKRNCIYFTDDYKGCYMDDPDLISDMGVFNLDDKTVGPLYHDSNLQRLNWPPLIWFMPTLS